MVDAAVAALRCAGLDGPFAVHDASSPGVIDRRMHQVFVGVSGHEAELLRSLSGRLANDESIITVLAATTDDVVVLPAWKEPHSGGVAAVPQIVDRLLGPGGCPWDQEQTHESLKRHLIEESYELVEAIDSKDDAKMREELGDVLLQPAMHAQMSKRDGGWDLDAVALALVEKLIRRHPHVFGNVLATSSEEVLKNWDAIKLAEKPNAEQSILQGIPASLPALLRAYEISKRAARVGFEWSSLEAVLEQLEEEDRELREAILVGNLEDIESELGDVLFTVVNVARWMQIEPESALRKMLARFTARFQTMERFATKPLRDHSPEEWDALWKKAKSVVA